MAQTLREEIKLKIEEDTVALEVLIEQLYFNNLILEQLSTMEGKYSMNKSVIYYERRNGFNYSQHIGCLLDPSEWKYNELVFNNSVTMQKKIEYIKVEITRLEQKIKEMNNNIEEYRHHLKILDEYIIKYINN